MLPFAAVPEASRGLMVESRRRSARLGRRLRRLFVLLLSAWILSSAGLVLLLRWVDPPVSAVMLQRLAGEGAPQRQEWVDIEQIDPSMALAVVAAEDQRFPDHWGFDTTEIIAAVERHLDGERLRGASTISQQVARNLFLWQGRSFLRKGLEVWFTGLIELAWPKRRILEMYLNFAETGSACSASPSPVGTISARAPVVWDGTRRLCSRRSCQIHWCIGSITHRHSW